MVLFSIQYVNISIKVITLHALSIFGKIIFHIKLTIYIDDIKLHQMFVLGKIVPPDGYEEIAKLLDIGCLLNTRPSYKGDFMLLETLWNASLQQI